MGEAHRVTDECSTVIPHEAHHCVDVGDGAGAIQRQLCRSDKRSVNHNEPRQQ